MDGGMLFELNKVYSDYGEYAVEHNKDLIIDLYGCCSNKNDV